VGGPSWAESKLQDFSDKYTKPCCLMLKKTAFSHHKINGMGIAREELCTDRLMTMEQVLAPKSV
jgi:hypothetical protein